MSVAQEFANHQVCDLESNNAQDILLSYFNAETSQINQLNRAWAGLCLRCYISEPILKECKKIASLFSSEKQFTYRDLLPFVLNDRGEKLIVLDRDGKTQLTVDDYCQIKPSTYKLFSVTVLQTFNYDLQSRMSLDNWAYLQTKQNPELKKFLSEFGFKHLSDWALLNRTRTEQCLYFQKAARRQQAFMDSPLFRVSFYSLFLYLPTSNLGIIISFAGIRSRTKVLINTSYPLPPAFFVSQLHDRDGSILNCHCFI